MRKLNPSTLRFTIASVMALLVTGVALFTVSGQSSGRPYVFYMQSATIQELKLIHEHIHKYREKYGKLPTAIDYDYHKNAKDEVIDYWDRPYIYLVHGDSYRIISYGADGIPGGIGLDADLASDDSYPQGSKPARLVPTRWQVVTHPFCTFLVMVSFASGALTFVLTWLNVRPRQLIHENLRVLWVKLFFTFIGASFAAVFLIFFHLVFSGH
jgi:hypothetical protein